MGVLTRYFYKEFLKLFAVFEAVFLLIYLLVDFIEKIDNFVEAQVPTTEMFAYFYFKIPLIIMQMVPVAALLSIIVMLSQMKKNNEIISIRSCGTSIFELSRPIIHLSICLAIFSFFFSELVVSHCSGRSNEIWNSQVEKRDRKKLFVRKHIWYKGPNSIYWIRHFDASKQVMKDISLCFFDDSFELIKKIDAKRGTWIGKEWDIRDGIIQKRGKEGRFDVENFDKIRLRLPEGPETFKEIVKKPEEMSYWQLRRYAEAIQAEGYDAAEYLVDMHVKLAFPAISLVMALLGIPVVLRLKKGGTPLAVTLGIGLCFLYLVVLGLSRSLGLSGLLPPVLSAWLANGIFSLLGIYAMMGAEY